MTTEKAVNRVLDNAPLKSYATRLAGPNAADCISELCATICEKSQAELDKVEPYFDFWCVRVVRNMNGKRGAMAKYRSEDIDQHRLELAQHFDHREEALSRVGECLEKMYWYDREMFLAYLEEGSLRKLADKIQLPIVTIYDTVKRVREQIQWALK